jgi:hypothetical protein
LVPAQETVKAELAIDCTALGIAPKEVNEDDINVDGADAVTVQTGGVCAMTGDSKETPKHNQPAIPKITSIRIFTCKDYERKLRLNLESSNWARFALHFIPLEFCGVAVLCPNHYDNGMNIIHFCQYYKVLGRSQSAKWLNFCEDGSDRRKSRVPTRGTPTQLTSYLCQ